jgi:hypothetical protein
MNTWSKPTREQEADEIAIVFKSQLGINGEYGERSIWYLPANDLSLDYLENKVDINFSTISCSSFSQEEGISIDVTPTKNGFKYVESQWGVSGYWHESVPRVQAEKLIEKIKLTYQEAIPVK